MTGKGNSKTGTGKKFFKNNHNSSYSNTSQMMLSQRDRKSETSNVQPSTGIHLENQAKNVVDRKIFRLRAIEFGNTYHVAGAILCEPEKYAVDICECSCEQIIFLINVLPKDNIIYQRSVQKEEIESLPCSTEIIENSCKNSGWNRITEKLQQAFMQSLLKDRSTDKFAELWSKHLTKFKNLLENRDKLEIFHLSYFINESEKLKIALIETLLNQERSNPKSKDEIEKKYLNYLQNKVFTEQIDQDNEKIIIHVRNLKDKFSHRNLNADLLDVILKSVSDVMRKLLEVIFIGDELDERHKETITKYPNIRYHYLNKIETGIFYNNDSFKALTNADVIAGQLFIYYLLHKQYNVKCAIGVKSGGLDGLAFIGIPTIFFTLEDGEEKRMNKASEEIKTLKPIMVKGYSALPKNLHEILSETIKKLITSGTFSEKEAANITKLNPKTSASQDKPRAWSSEKLTMDTVTKSLNATLQSSIAKPCKKDNKKQAVNISIKTNSNIN